MLVRGASKLALRLGLSPLFIGLTIVGAGTSSPEVGASVTASLKELDDIAVGNVVGSNIFNLLLILGISAAVTPITIAWRTIKAESWWMIAAGMVPIAALAVADRSFGLVIGIVLLAGLVAYLVLSYRTARRLAAQEQATRSEERPGIWLNSALVLAGLALLVFGSSVFVTSAAKLGAQMGISERVIGLTIVAAGTSLPELATSLVAALRKQSAIAVGNILGSNVFNVFGILGLCAVIRPQRFSPSVLSLDVPIMIGASVLVTALLWRSSGLGRWAGLALIVCYLVYLGVLVAGV
jgi:cation:H+ antiporter